MKHSLYSSVLVALLLTLFPVNSALATSSGIVINEIAWMGTTVSANDEWVELYNSTGQIVNLDGWILKTADNKLNIKLSGNIAPGSFYLLERTDDESVPNIVADLIYSGALANGGEHLQLYDAIGVLIDEIDCAEKLALSEANGWVAGDNSVKKTMSKIGQDWEDSQNPGGTPKASNATLKTSEKLTENSSLSTLSYPTGIVINEVLPSPDGADETEEWIVPTIQLIPSACS